MLLVNVCIKNDADNKRNMLNQHFTQLGKGEDTPITVFLDHQWFHLAGQTMLPVVLMLDSGICIGYYDDMCYLVTCLVIETPQWIYQSYMEAQTVTRLGEV
mmetsp:Transcript_20327/g.38377  ORF Transcript_20327/g.38377 Transcript_20327/m.38377 type:complete len:101 (+) Transcript_20327:610-912(+)